MEGGGGWELKENVAGQMIHDMFKRKSTYITKPGCLNK